jgi:hypothetical protein
MRNPASFLAGVCLALALAGPAAAQEKRLLPVDDGATDASWVSFRNQLLNALAGRDRGFVLSVIAANVRNSMDVPPGIAQFRKHWETDSESSPLWRELSKALFLGSAWLKRGTEARQLCAPYVSVHWPDDVDPAFYGAITAKDVFLKSAPSHTAPTLTALSYDIVRVADWEVDDTATDVQQKWVRIRTREHEGFVPEEQVRSAIEHRACFVKTGDGWRMTSFVLGIQK